ncbi:unnamed protein product, partial [Brenthis ino]
MKSCMTKNLEYINGNKENRIHDEKKNFDNENDNNESIINPDYGDLYILGRIWIDVLKTALVGENLKLIPVVEAAKKTPADLLGSPKRPPPMKYTDLSLYECPHYEYKDYVESTEKCPDANVKLLHRYLLPHIKTYRKKAADCAGEIRSKVKQQCASTCATIRDAKKQFKDNMRDSNNLPIRQAVVAVSGVAGFFLGGGGGIPKRLFFTTLGFLTGGSLCFPKETDEVFRNVTYCAGKKFLEMYNMLCGTGVVLREKLPCKEDMPPPPPVRKPIVCPPKK